MFKFKPIAFSESDFRAFKYVSATNAMEGAICCVAINGTLDQFTMGCKLALQATATGAFEGAPQTMALQSASRILVSKDAFFPIYREDPDIDKIGATITHGQFVIGYTGSEFDIHRDAICGGVSGTGTLFSTVALGDSIGLVNATKVNASIGKYYCRMVHASASGVVIGQIIATMTAWIRLRRV